jgi:hypothetical protein
MIHIDLMISIIIDLMIHIFQYFPYVSAVHGIFGETKPKSDILSAPNLSQWGHRTAT